jgi:outer membrane protein assembly factor BamB
MRNFTYYIFPAFAALLAVNVAQAQRAVDWMTDGFDPQRSYWVHSDGKISLATMRKPGFEMIWKLKIQDGARQLNSLTPPALLDFYIGYRGFRTFAFIGLSSEKVVGIDVDVARIDWEKNLASDTEAAGTPACPGGLTSSVTRPTTISYPTFFASRGAGRATPAKSGVGAPDQGAVTIKPAAAATPRPTRVNNRLPVSAIADPANPYAARIQWVLALTGDGKLHSLYVSNGNEPKPAIRFLPPNAHAVGLVAYDNTAYAATTNSCGGVDNGIWSVELTTKKVNEWKSSGDVAGSAGPAVRPDGTLFVAAGSELAALAPKTLKPVARYKTGGAAFTSSPVIFNYKTMDLVAVAANDGLHLLDTANLSKPLDKTPPSATPDYAAGALSSWQDPAGVRWVFVPSGKTIAAWKVVDKNGAPAWEKGWVSRELVSPLTPVIVNGVMFALSSGEYRSSDAGLSAAERVKRSSHAVLYALDPVDGKELWSSGNSMTSFVHGGGISAGGGRVYVGAYDGTQYAFGFPMLTE